MSAFVCLRQAGLGSVAKQTFVEHEVVVELAAAFQHELER